MTATAPNGNNVIAPPDLSSWFEKNNVRFSVSRQRKSKLGDYRPPWKQYPARISVNEGLNSYEFIITLVHEMAHHETWKEWNKIPLLRKRRPAPHGPQWKRHYLELMYPLLTPEFFPEDILRVLRIYVTNPGATSKTSLELGRALKRYDGANNLDLIENLPVNSVFSLPDGRKFLVQRKLRKRYRCLNLDNKKTYLFHPLAKIIREPEV